jgi:hypothetical protein
MFVGQCLNRSTDVREDRRVPAPQGVPKAQREGALIEHAGAQPMLGGGLPASDNFVFSEIGSNIADER